MSTQSVNYDFILTLQMAQKYLYQYVVLVLMILGTIGCVFSLIVFTKTTFRKNPCSLYMIAYYIGNLTHIYTIILPSMLVFGYNQSISVQSIDACRFIIYMAVVLNVLCPSYLIFASIDRILITSSNATTRQRSTVRLAFISVISITLFWFLCDTHVLVFTKIFEVVTNYFVCSFQGGLYLTVFIYYSTTRALLIPFILAILGYWAIRNIRQVGKHRVHATGSNFETPAQINQQQIQSKDRQLIRIVLMDIVIYILSSFPLAIVSIYLQTIQYDVKTQEQSQINSFINYICVCIGYIPYCIGFYKNLFTSKTFRSEFMNIFLRK
ncbi:unnamed protein product [Adineta ricciae]|uniref:G-protein coupled receptors family 1 profile domain-containing protein n=1 Tax=Adineta ricciae TaxID=249248 RepID=A0A816BA73_ADIRI|nr:unnamed protein product [Adineta ricciae]CAF1608765.1 unnamed protein product [Adineta ricciae]